MRVKLVYKSYNTIFPHRFLLNVTINNKRVFNQDGTARKSDLKVVNLRRNTSSSGIGWDEVINILQMMEFQSLIWITISAPREFNFKHSFKSSFSTTL